MSGYEGILPTHPLTVGVERIAVVVAVKSKPAISRYKISGRRRNIPGSHINRIIRPNLSFALITTTIFWKLSRHTQSITNRGTINTVGSSAASRPINIHQYKSIRCCPVRLNISGVIASWWRYAPIALIGSEPCVDGLIECGIRTTTSKIIIIAPVGRPVINLTTTRCCSSMNGSS